MHASAQGQERDARAGEPEGEAERVGGGQAEKAAEGARAKVARAGAEGEGVAAVGGAQRRERAIDGVGVTGVEVGGREGAAVAPGVAVDGRREVGEVAEAAGLKEVDPPVGQASLRAGAAGGRGRVGAGRGVGGGAGGWWEQGGAHQGVRVRAEREGELVGRGGGQHGGDGWRMVHGRGQREWKLVEVPGGWSRRGAWGPSGGSGGGRKAGRDEDAGGVAAQRGG